MLTIEGLNQYYGGSHILKGVDLAVPEGVCTCLMGRNGMGKTTLLKCLMGLVPIAKGSIRLDDAEIAALRPQRRARLGLAYVPQGREIFPQLTVMENLRVALAGRRNSAVPERIFELFPVLREMANRRGGDLSGGQQQQLAIGRALVLEPRVLILDEPTEGIQPNIVQQIGAVIRRLNRDEGMTILLVEQKLHFAREVGDDRVDLREDWTLRIGGRLVWADRFALTPETMAVLDAPAGLDGARALATVVVLSPEPEACVERLRALLETVAEPRGGVTRRGPLVLLRLLDRDAARLRGVFGLLWAEMRGLVLDAPPRMPAIWRI